MYMQKAYGKITKAIVQKSDQKNKKYKAVMYDRDDKRIKTVNFGDPQYKDYT